MEFNSSRRKFMKAGIILPEEIQSVHCSDCSSCAIQCPNGVDVRTRLIRAQELLA